jgi:HK97 family phage major capsid protein
VATTVRSGLLVPQILTESVQAGFAAGTVKPLLGSQAAIINGSLPESARGGDTVTVPYFNSMGELEDVAENAALTPATLTQSTETAVVQRSGKAFEITRWARQAASLSDPYAEATRQIMEASARRADKALIDAASASLPAMTLTVATKLDYDLVIDGKMLWADEQEDIALMVVTSKTFGTMLKLKDSTGRPLVVDPVNGGPQRFANIPFLVSDRLPVSAGVHTTLILKRNALTFWYGSRPVVEPWKDVLKDTDILALNVYYVAYRYKNLPGLDKPGVVILKHTV